MITGSIGDIFVRLGIDPSGLSSGFDKAESTLESMGNKLFYMGARLTAGLTVPILAAGGAITKWGLEFDKAMTESLAIMSNVSPRIREEMEHTARTVSETTKFSAKEAAEAYYDLASAGLTASEAVGSLDTTARFAMAGVMDLAKAGEYLAGTVASVGNASLGVTTKIEGMAKMADLLTQANNFALGTVEDFAKAMSNKAGQAMRMYNISVEEGLSVLMAYAEQNIKGAAAGQQFWMVTRDLQRAVVRNSEAFKRLNIDVFDINGNLNNLASIIQQMEKAFAGLSDEQRNAALTSLGFQDRSKAAILALVGMSSEIFRFQGVLGKAAGVMDEVAKKQMEALSNQLKALWHAFQNIAISIFTEFVPVIKDYLIPFFTRLVDKLKEFSGWLKTLTTEQKAWVLGILAALAAIGPLITALGTFLILLRAISSPFQALLRMWAALKGGAGFGGVIQAIVGMTGGMKGAAAATDDIVEGMSAIGRERVAITGVTSAMGGASAATSTWGGVMGRVFSGISRLLGPIGIAIAAITAAMSLKNVVGGWDRFYSLLNAMTMGVLHAYLMMIKDIYNITFKLGSLAVSWTNSLYNGLKKLASPLGDVLNWLTDIGEQQRKNVNEYSDKLEMFLFGPGPLPDVKSPLDYSTKGGLPTAIEDAEKLIDPLTGMIKPWQPASLTPKNFFDADEDAEEAKRAAQKAKELLEELSGATAIKGAQELMAVMAKLPPVQYLTKEAQEKVNETLFKAIQAYKAMGQTAPEAMRATYEATYRNVLLPDMLADHAREMLDEGKQIADAQLKFAEGVVEANQRVFQEAISGAGDIFEEYDQRFMTVRDKQIKDADKWATDMFKKIEPLKDQLPGMWEAAAADIRDVQGHMKKTTVELARFEYETLVKSNTATIKEIRGAWKNWFEEWYDEAHSTVVSIAKSVKGLSDAFRQLARIAGGAFKTVVTEIYEILEGMEQIFDAMKDFEQARKNMADRKAAAVLTGGKVDWRKQSEDIILMTGALIQMGVAFWETTGKGSTFKRTVGGAMQGMQIGYQLGGPAGAWVGLGVGALVGLFRGLFGVSTAEKEGREAAAKFRNALLEGLSAKQMAEVREAMEGVWKGNKAGAATMIAVRDAFAKAGKSAYEAEIMVRRLWEAEKKGPKEVEKVMKEIQAVMDRVAERHANAELFVQRLGDAFQYVNDKGQLANAQMLEALQTAKDLGGATDAVAGIMKVAFDRTTRGMQAFLDNVEDANGDTLQAIATSLVAFTQAMQDAGMSLVDIITQITPVMEKLREKMKDAGLDGTEAFEQIARMTDYLTEEKVKAAITAISGLNDIIIGLHNAGLLNQETFSTLSRQITDTFDNLIGQGFDGDTVLRLIAPSLQTLWELMTDFGFSVDESTQALINQGLEAGIIGEDMRSDQEALKEIMEDLVAVMKEFVEEMRIARGEMDGLADASARVAVPRGTTGTETWTDPSGMAYDREHYGRGYVDVPQMAEGAFVTGPTPAIIGEGRYDEYVLPEPMLKGALAEAEEDEESGNLTVEVNIQTYSSAGFEQLIDDKLVPGIMTAIRRNRRGAKTELKNIANS